MEKSDSNMIRLCGLWKGKSQNGTQYLSGKLGNARVFIFAVREKRSDKSPDYTRCIAPAEQGDDTQPAQSSVGGQKKDTTGF
jgi:hypothetical protein